MVHLHPGNIYSETSPIFFFCGAVSGEFGMASYQGKGKQAC
jgi:hypothetical protein